MNKQKLAIRITLLYALAAGGWILLSDWLAATLWADAATLAHTQTYKGLAFVAVTTGLLFFALRRWARAIETEAGERRQAEAELTRHHDLYRRAIVAADAIPYSRDYAAGKYLFMDERIREVTGYGPAELTSEVWKEIIQERSFFGEASGLTVEEAVRRTLAGELAHWRVDYRLRTRSGEMRWVSDSAIQIPGPDGKPTGSVGILQDITERKRVELALRESESQLRQLADSLPQLVWTCTPDGQCDYLNRQWVDYTGVPAGAQLGRGWLNQVHPDDRARLLAGWEASVANGQAFSTEYRLRRHDGTYRWFDDRAVALRNAEGRIVKWYGSNSDIHEGRELRERLQAKEEKLRLIFEAEPECVKLLAADGTVREINPAGVKLLEACEAAEVLGTSILPVVQAEFRPAVGEMLAASARGEPRVLEFEIRCLQGATRWMEMRTAPFRDPTTGEALVLGVSRDVSERRRAEESLRLGQERLRACIENTPNVAVQWYDEAGRVIYWNRASENMFGWPAREALGCTPEQLTQSPEQAAQFLASLRQLQSTNRIVGPMESTFRRKDGSTGARLSTLFRIRFDDRTPCFVSMDVDISALKASRADAEQSLSLLRAALEATAEGILVVDRRGQATSYNQKFLELWRLSPSALRSADGEAALTLVLDQLADPGAFRQRVQGLEQSPATSSQEVLNLRDGRTFEGYSHPQRLGEEIVGRVWGFREVTERRRVERLVVQSELRLRLVWENALDAMRLSEASGEVVLVNDAYCRLTGKARSELEGQPFTIVYEASLRAQFQSDFSAGFERREVRHTAAVPVCFWNGRRAWLESSDVFLELTGEPPLLLTILSDVTDRQRAEYRNAVFAAMVHELSAASSRAAAASHVVAAAQKLLGWDACFLYLYDAASDSFDLLVMRDDFDGQVRDVPPPPADQRPEHPLRLILQRGSQLILREEHEEDPIQFLPFGNVQRRSASLMYVAIRDADKPIGVLSIQSYTPRAYTEQSLATLTSLAEHCASALVRIRAEQVLEQSERRFRSLIENATDLITVLDGEGKVRFQSPSIQTVLGYRSDRLIGEDALALVHPEDLPRATAALQQAVAQPGQTVTFEGRLRHADGSYRRLEVIGRQAGPEAGLPGVILNSRDVTASRALEEQFRQAQKMEAIGHLAGGIAHDFNNLLAVITMQVELLQVETGLTDEQRESAQEIGKAAQRAAHLTRQLLLFSRRQAIRPRELDLNETVGNLGTMLQRLLGEDIHMEFRCATQPLAVRADPSMLDQVLLNLAVNARDAMPKGGRLTVTTSSVELDEVAAAAMPEGRPGRFVCLTVSDTGSGITPEILPHIFEPFFTTKDVGKGTGLGLATVFGIVQQHKGWITVDSAPGRGSTFRVFLPRLEVAPPTAAPESSLAAAPRGSETILLVEDEAALRALVRSVLTRLGYRVLEAPSGPAALEQWAQHRAEIKLLLTDIVMPDGLSGKELAQRLQSDQPSLKVIYTSGYSKGVVGLDTSLREGENFLAKPYQATKLAATVRARLDA